MHSYVVEEDGIRTYGVAISNTLSLNLIALKFIVENKRETDGAAQKPTQKPTNSLSNRPYNFNLKCASEIARLILKE